MTIHQFVVRSSTPTSSEALNIWHCDAVVPAQDAADLLRTAYLEFADVVTTAASFTIDPVSRNYDESTGTLLAFNSVTWSAAVPGTGAGTRAADATAALIAWETGSIVGGRPVRGRTFIPYPSLTVLGAGAIQGAALSLFQGVVDAALPSLQSGQFGIWRRPVAGVPGVFSAISSGAARSEYSMQKRRRN